MNRRGFLGLGTAVAAALVLPEARKLYFIGGWPGPQAKLITHGPCFRYDKNGVLLEGYEGADDWASDLARIRNTLWYQGMVVARMEQLTLDANIRARDLLPRLAAGSTVNFPLFKSLEIS